MCDIPPDWQGDTLETYTKCELPALLHDASSNSMSLAPTRKEAEYFKKNIHFLLLNNIRSYVFLLIPFLAARYIKHYQHAYKGYVQMRLPTVSLLPGGRGFLVRGVYPPSPQAAQNLGQNRKSIVL